MSSACSSSAASMPSSSLRVVGVVASEVGDHLRVALDGDALGDQVLGDHVAQRRAFLVLGVAAGRQAVRIEVGLPAELHDARGDASACACSSVACSRNSCFTDSEWMPSAMK